MVLRRTLPLPDSSSVPRRLTPHSIRCRRGRLIRGAAASPTDARPSRDDPSRARLDVRAEARRIPLPGLHARRLRTDCGLTQSTPFSPATPETPSKRGLLALTINERAIMLSALEDPPEELAELRAVLLADYQWRRSEGLD